MAIIIGCSGSTGSSLLKTILNRHSQLFAGPEAGLFAFPQVINDWGKHKFRLLNGLKTDGWQLRYGMSLLQPAFGWQEKELYQIIEQARSFPAFIKTFFGKPLQEEGKKIWVAKTPANAMGMAAFLHYFPTGKAVQTVRNPYDTIASLMARGMNVYVATAYYVYNTAAATSNLGSNRYFHLKYEDLVVQPEPTLLKLFDFLNIPFEPAILIAQHEKRVEPDSIKGWKHKETAEVNVSSIGRFQGLAAQQQDLVRSAVSTFRISDSYCRKKNIQFKSAKELCTSLGYDYLSTNAKKYQSLLKKYYWKDRFGRIKHGFWWQFFDYMGVI